MSSSKIDSFLAEGGSFLSLMGFVEPQFHFLIKKNNNTQTENSIEHQGPHLLTMSTIPTQAVGFMISYFIDVC